MAYGNLTVWEHNKMKVLWKGSFKAFETWTHLLSAYFSISKRSSKACKTSVIFNVAILNRGIFCQGVSKSNIQKVHGEVSVCLNVCIRLHLGTSVDNTFIFAVWTKIRFISKEGSLDKVRLWERLESSHFFILLCFKSIISVSELRISRQDTWAQLLSCARQALNGIVFRCAVLKVMCKCS